MKRVVISGYKILAIIITALAIAIAAFSIWIIIEPRSIPYISTKIEETLNDVSKSFNVSVKDSVLKWEGIKKGLGLYITDIHILGENKKEVAALPDIRIKLDILSILSGSVVLKDVFVNSPEISIKKELIEDVEDDFSLNPISVYKRIVIDILSTIEANNNRIPIKNIWLNNAKILFEHNKQDVSWNLPSASLKFILVGDIVNFRSRIEGNFSDELSIIKTEGYFEDKNFLRVRSEFEKIPPRVVSDVVDNLDWLNDIRLKFNGEATFLLTQDGLINSGEFRVYNNAFLNTPQIEASGEIDFLDEYNGVEHVPEIHINAAAVNLKSNDLKDYWPDLYAPKVRQWLTDNLKDGFYTSSTVELTIKADDFVNKKLSEGAINATINFKDIDLSYHSDFPSIERVKGVARLKENSADIDISEGYVGTSLIKDGKVIISNMSQKERVSLEATGNFDGKLRDAIAFVNNIDIENKDVISGSTKGNFSISFPIRGNLKKEDFKINVHTDVSNIDIVSFTPYTKITDGNLKFKKEDEEISINGNIDVSTLEGESPFPPALSIPNLDVFNGNLIVDYQSTITNGKESVMGALVADNAEIDATRIGWHKDSGIKAGLSFVAERGENEPYNLKTFQIVSKDFLVSGNGVFSKEDGGYNNINFDSIKYGNNDYELNITKNATNRYGIVARGEKADFSNLITHGIRSFSKDEFAIDVTADFKELFLANDSKMNNVVGILKCDLDYCKFADFKGEFQEGGGLAVQFIPSEENKEVLKLSILSDNAGAVLGGLNILKDVRGGTLDFGAYTDNDEGGGRMLKGKTVMKDFKVTKAPILAKLLTVGSFTGVVDLLNGEGIKFKKLKGEINYRGGVINVNELKAHGNALGITSDGNIDIKKSDLHLEGAVIPSYALNSFLGNIPIIGNVFVGKEGEGIIASRYKVIGKLKEPEVSVNPLSMLTPGFLRNIWGGKSGEFKEEFEEETAEPEPTQP